MSERPSYVIDQALSSRVEEGLQVVSALDSFARTVQGSGDSAINPAQETEAAPILEMFTDLHLGAFAHEYQYGSRLRICESIFKVAKQLLWKAMVENNPQDEARLEYMFDYARSAADQVPRLIEPELHESLALLAMSGGSHDEDFPGREALRQRALVDERYFGRKLELMPSNRSLQVIEAQKARDNFDMVQTVRPAKPFPADTPGVKSPMP